MKDSILKILFFTILSVGCFYFCSSFETCNIDSDCPKGSKCINKKCYSNAFTPDPQVIDPSVGCSKDNECGVCKICDNGICKPVEGCDAGVVILDGSRDIVTLDNFDIEDTLNDILDAETDVDDIEEISEVGDLDFSDTLDGGVDVSDLSGCDINLTLKVTNREPAGDLPRGTVLKLRGQGFDNVCGTISVFFSGDPNPAKIVAVQPNEVTVIVPGFAKNGNITVNSFGQTDKSLKLNIIRRMFFSDFGDSLNPGNQFFVLSFPDFIGFKKAKYDINGSFFPLPLLLDPFNLWVLVISNKIDNEYNGYLINAYDFSNMEFIKNVENVNAKSLISGGMIDYEKERIYLISMDGYLYVHQMGTLTLLKTIPLGVALYGIDIDKVNNRLFLSGVYNNALPSPAGPPKEYIGAVFIIDRETFKPVGNEVITIGGTESILTDVKYHPETNRLFTVDFIAGDLYVFDPDDLGGELTPISLAPNSGPMKLTFGKNNEKVYIVCNNSVEGPRDATATVRAFDTMTLNEIGGSPFDTQLVTSTSQSNSKHLVNIVYDDQDGYLFVTTGADKRIGVIVESTFTYLSSPQSPENTYTETSSGNFGIVIEDW